MIEPVVEPYRALPPGGQPSAPVVVVRFQLLADTKTSAYARRWACAAIAVALVVVLLAIAT